jgi:hypothetical protein
MTVKAITSATDKELKLKLFQEGLDLVENHLEGLVILNWMYDLRNKIYDGEFTAREVMLQIDGYMEGLRAVAGLNNAQTDNWFRESRRIFPEV